MKKKELTVKNVPFCSSELLAVQDKETGKIYAGINSILRELGFDERQVRYRREKWTEDRVISKGVQKFCHPSQDGGTQETYCIEIKRLPLALAKIEITKKMKQEMPELSDKLEKYQEDCADVLADAFLPQTDNCKTSNDKIPIRMYKNNKWYMLTIGEEVYSLKVKTRKGLFFLRKCLTYYKNCSIIVVKGGIE